MKTVKMTPEVLEILKNQKAAFIKKFGRAPGPKDPVFFDPNSNTPKEMNEEKVKKLTSQAMVIAGIPPQFQYAYQKTGFLISGGNKHLFSKEQQQEWNETVKEYFEMKSEVDKG